MKIEAIKPIFQGPRPLRYRWHVRLVYPISILFIIYYSLHFLIFPILASRGSIDPNIIVLHLLALFFQLIFCWNIARQLYFKEFNSTDDSISLTNCKQKIELYLNDIIRVDFSYWGPFGCWYTLVMEDGKRFHFTSLIERPEYPLEKIYKNRRDLIPDDKFKDFASVLISSDHSWAQIYWLLKNMWFWIFIFLVWLVLPSLTAMALWKKQSELISDIELSYWPWNIAILGVPILIGSCIIWGLLIIWERNSIRRFNQTGSKIRDMKQEQVGLKRSVLFSVILSVFYHTAIYRLDLNVYRITQFDQAVSKLNIQKSDYVLYRPKNFCFKEVQSQNKSLIIFIERAFEKKFEIATVKPSALKKEASTGRSIASVASRDMINQDRVVATSLEDDIIHTYSTHKIRGCFFR